MTYGYLSTRINKNNILITTKGSCLGDLRYSDIIKINLNKKIDIKTKHVSTEFPLHSLIYKHFPNIKTIIHCHPTLINAYFAVYSSLKTLSLQTKIYLGNIPVVKLDTPSVTKPQIIIDALEI